MNRLKVVYRGGAWGCVQGARLCAGGAGLCTGFKICTGADLGLCTGLGVVYKAQDCVQVESRVQGARQEKF